MRTSGSRLQRLRGVTDPEATVIGYVYFNYFVAPTTGSS